MRCVSLPRLLVFSASLVGLAGVGIPSASAAPPNSIPDRITTPVTNSNASPIPNSVHPQARLATDLGPAPADTSLGMSIRFNMSAAQQAALDQLLADQQNPSSPRYHQWLTPAQFGAQFGLSSNDLAKVSTWLTSQGFTVTGVANGGAFIHFDGSVAQAQAAFHTSIHSLSVNGENHFANVTDISVPSAFAGVVVGVTGLHDFRLKPHLHASIAKPQFTSDQTGNHFITPGDIDTIYNSYPLLNGTPAITGAGITIAVTGQVDLYNTGTAAAPVYADVNAFRSAAWLSAVNLTTVHAYGYDPGAPVCDSCSSGPNDGDLEESTIDVEWSGAMAPSANILFVNGQYVMPYAMDWAVDNDLAPIVTTSYGLCEAGWGTTELISLNALFAQANAQGQTILAAAGDSGSTDCDAGPSAIEGLTADFPASSPYVTGMGGTEFNGDAEATGSGTTWAATQYWAGTSGSDVVSSALSYIPEAVWNDETAAAGYSFGGGGGGASAFFSKPAWQVGTGVPVDGARDVPDLALDAAASHDYLLFCVTLSSVSSCTSGFRNSSGEVDGDSPVGGTSFDSQMFGGMLALIEQKTIATKGLGNINPNLYALANSTYYSPGSVGTISNGYVFNDVTTGNNEMPCIAGTVNCLNGGTIGFGAGSGYDLASGWGSVNVSNLAAAWTKVTPLSGGSLGANLTATALTIPPQICTAGNPCTANVTSGATVTLTATVTGSAGTPTGKVQFFANNVALGSAIAVTALNGTTATATYSWVTSCSNLGQQVMSASYSGDGNYQGSVGGGEITLNGASQASNGSFVNDPVTVQVANSGSCADFALTPSGTGFTVSGNNASVTVAAAATPPPITVNVAPSNGFTGTVALTTTVITTNQDYYVPNITLSPATVTISSSSSVATTLNITGFTQASLRIPSLPGNATPGRTPWYAAGSGVTIASLLLLVLPRRRRLGGLLLVLLAVALIGGATGCGSSQQGPPSTTTTGPDAYSGTYVVTVNGQFSGAKGQITQHIATVTYNVE
jgi:hypothetical protein